MFIVQFIYKNKKKRTVATQAKYLVTIVPCGFQHLFNILLINGLYQYHCAWSDNQLYNFFNDFNRGSDLCSESKNIYVHLPMAMLT